MTDQERISNLEFAVAALTEAIKALITRDDDRARENVRRAVESLFRNDPNVTVAKPAAGLRE